LDGLSEYVCSCPCGITGVNCQVNIDDCFTSPCHHGICTDALANFTCACEPGWIGNLCEINVDECQRQVYAHVWSIFVVLHGHFAILFSQRLKVPLSFNMPFLYIGLFLETCYTCTVLICTGGVTTPKCRVLCNQIPCQRLLRFSYGT